MRGRSRLTLGLAAWLVVLPLAVAAVLASTGGSPAGATSSALSAFVIAWLVMFVVLLVARARFGPGDSLVGGPARAAAGWTTAPRRGASGGSLPVGTGSGASVWASATPPAATAARPRPGHPVLATIVVSSALYLLAWLGLSAAGVFGGLVDSPGLVIGALAVWLVGRRMGLEGGEWGVALIGTLALLIVGFGLFFAAGGACPVPC